jgi:hypothetical protein
MATPTREGTFNVTVEAAAYRPEGREQKKGRPFGLPLFYTGYDVCALRFDDRYEETESVQKNE